MKKVFLVANEKALSKKRQRGVSMVSLVITIIVMLILSGIIFLSSTDSIEQAGVGVFVREIALVRQAANEKKLDNQIAGTSEENTYKGFYKTKIKNPPVNFVSFSEDEIYGYVIDLEYVHTEDAERGHDYKRFATNVENNFVEFGVDDVYVVDKEGNVFYAKGWITDEGVHYSNMGIELNGPEIVSVGKDIADDQKSATISVEVKKVGNGTLSVKVGGVDATKTATSDDGLTETFEATVGENKTYIIIAEETGEGKSTSSIEVTELDLVTYTIKYMPNATNVLNMPDNQTKTENISTNLSTKIPQRAGYTFLGWNENALATFATYRPGGEFIKDGTPGNPLIHVYAIWKLGKEEKYSVTYNANGGTNAPMAVENISGEYTITTEKPQRADFEFTGWSKDSKATTAEYSGGETITLTENVTLYAVWSKGTYTVTVKTSIEGAGTVTGNASKPDGVEVFVTTNPNPGYAFKNWTVMSGGVNLKNATALSTSFTMPKNSVEIVANYEVQDYTVKFNANRGTGAPSAKVVKYGEKIEIPTTKPTRAGYDFKGWALKQDANSATHQENQEYIVTQSVTFYAVWQVHIETYTLKFNLNGGYGNTNGEIGKFVEQTKTEGGQIVIPIGGQNEPYKKDFVFKGWALSKDSTDVVLRPGDTYSRDANLEIFAVWKDETDPVITLEPKQEEGSDEVKIIATAYDAGKIAEYAWTTSNVYPTAWQTDGISGENVKVEKVINQKGTHYFWAKDLSGNYIYQAMTAYEIKYDALGGMNTPSTQFQLQNTELTLTKTVPTKEKYTFLGWSIAENPGNTTADVNFQKGGKLNINADTTLKAVWGEAFFGLSAKTAVTQIDGANVDVTVTKSEYTGEISVSSSDTDIATVTITDNIITIVPGTKIGEVEITVVESRVGTTEKIVVTVERGIRKVTLDRTTQNFTYGDSSAKIEFSYNGKTTGLSTTTSNETVATATASGKTLTIKPENYGTAVIGLVFAQDDQYLEKTVEVEVTVGKKQIIVTPNSNQSKVYDATISTPELKYTFEGNTGSETPKFNGELTRTIGSDVGKYEIQLGSLELMNNEDFLVENYELVFSTTKVYFEITPKRITVPTANTPQQYDGTQKEGIAEGEDYIRGGEYQKTNAGNYTAIATLKDTKNFVWDDTNATTARNIRWEITSLDLMGAEAKVDEIPSQVYTGYEIKPLTVIKCDGVELVNGTDYSLSYTNNIDVGYATVMISGKGNYRGVIEKNFEITKATMQVDVSGYTGTFDNQEHTIKVSPIWPSTGYTIYYSQTELTNDNYTTGLTTAPKLKNPGTVKMYYYIKAPNFEDYFGSADVKITQKDIGGNITILGLVDKSYTGSEITQTITVRDNEQSRNLVERAEYTVAYTNNINVGTATITLTGVGNYTGTKTATFNILGDVITISRNTELLVTELEITITKTLPVGTLQYKIDNGTWIDYTDKFTITKDCTIYAQSIHNGNVIGTTQLTITNICEHEYTEATCTEDSICKYCELFNSPKLGHEFTVESATPDYLATAATCTDAATYYHKCVRCTAKGSTTYSHGEELGHEYTSETATPQYLYSAATCTEKAVYYHKCIRCTAKGTTTYQYGTPLGHDFTEKEATEEFLKSEATCTVATTYYYKCSLCGIKGTNTYTVGEPEGHDFTVQIINGTYLASEATCEMPAQYYYKCSKCDAKSTDTYSYGEPTGHSFGDFVTITEANCIEAGSHRKTCQWCGTSVTEEVAIDPTNHYGPITYEDTVEPTCTTTGTRKHTCTACNTVVKFETLAALGHEWNAPQAPRKCNRCGLEENTMVQAIYTAGNTTLTFTNDVPYAVGDTYGEETVTAVYTGIEESAYSAYRNVPWYSHNSSITNIVFKNEITPISTAYWFYDCINLTKIESISNLNTNSVTDMRCMFVNCESLVTFDASGFNTENVTNMRAMFSGCSSLTTIDVSDWNTEKVTDMGNMFVYCADLTTLDVSNWNPKNVTNMSMMFYYCESLTLLDSSWNTGSVKDMSKMFGLCKSLGTLNVSGWNTSQVENMEQLFYNCSSLTTLDVSGWNTGNVTNMQMMFDSCKKLTTLDVSRWNTQKVTDMSYMFNYCSHITTLNVTNFNTSQVTDMSWMFADCQLLTELNVSGFVTSNVSNMCGMFDYCYSLTSIGDLSSWNTSNVTSMYQMFSSCKKLTSINVSNWNTSNVIYMGGMFANCEAVTHLDLETFNTSKVTYDDSYAYPGMSGMFTNCNKLEEVTLGKDFNFSGDGSSSCVLPTPNPDYITGATGVWYDISDNKQYAPADIPNNYAATYVAVKPKTVLAANSTWYSQGGTEINRNEITSIDIVDSYDTTGKTIVDQWDASTNITSVNDPSGRITAYIEDDGLGTGTYKLTLAGDNSGKIYANEDSSWLFSNEDNSEDAFVNLTTINNGALLDTSKATTFEGMFFNAQKLTGIDVSNWNTENVTSLYATFAFCISIENLDVSNWNVVNVTSMEYTFGTYYTTTGFMKLVSIGNVSEWNTSKVKNMSSMFQGCYYLESVDVSNWDTTNVTNMSFMFTYCYSLENLDVSNWQTGNVTDFIYMFGFCRSLKTLNVSEWNTSSATNMGAMFVYCEKITSLDFSNWNVSKVTIMVGMFENCSSMESYDFSGWNTESLKNVNGMFNDNFNLTSIDVTDWDVSKVEDMGQLFENCYKLTEIDLSTWDTSNVKNMNEMFAMHFIEKPPVDNLNCISSLKTIYVSDSFNTENVETSDIMFHRCNALVGGLGTTYNPNYTDKTYARIDGGTSNPGYLTNNIVLMYREVGLGETVEPQLTFNSKIFDENSTAKYEIASYDGATYISIDENTGAVTGRAFGSAKVKVTLTAANGSTISTEATVNVQHVAQAIYTESDGSLTFVKNVANYKAGDTYNGKTITAVYKGFETVKHEATWSENYGLINAQCTGPWSENATNIKKVVFVDEITPISTSGWFANFTNCDSFENLNLINTSNVTDMSFMFCGAQDYYDATTFKITGMENWDTSKVTTMKGMFNEVGRWASETWTIGNISNWNTSNVTDMSYMFKYAGNCATTSVTLGSLSGWDLGKVTTLKYMLYGVGSQYPSFDMGSLSRWNVSNVTDMRGLFGTTAVTSTVWELGDLSSWDTSKVTDMAEMFIGHERDKTDAVITGISNWKVSNVKDMTSMFQNVGGMAQTVTIDISGWDTSNVENMKSMFSNTGCNTTETDLIGVNNLNTSKVTDMSYMFNESRAIKVLDLSKWDTTNVTTMQNMFYHCFRLQEVTLGEKFAFVGTNGYLPAPSNSYITGATGVWYNRATGSDYAPADVHKNTTTIVTYVALYTPYTITYELNGGTLASENPSTYTEYFDDITLNNPTREGYTFAGWTGSNGTDPQTTVTITTGSTGDKEYSANWLANTYYVKYNANGGSGTMSNSSHVYDFPKSLSTNTFTRTGYTFKGWATTSNGAVTYVDKVAVNNLTAVNGGIVNLYAVWNVNSYTVTLSSPYGTTALSGAGTYQYGTSVTIDATIASGYTWSQWSGTYNTTTKKYTFTMPAYDVNLKANVNKNGRAIAVYSSTDNSLTFYKNSDTITVGSTYMSKAVTATWTDFENTYCYGYSDVGWEGYWQLCKKIIVYDYGIKPIDMSYWFDSFGWVTSYDLNKLDTSNCERMVRTFMNGSSHVTGTLSIDLSSWDVSSCYDMQKMFESFGKVCNNLTVNLSNWKLTSGPSIYHIFRYLAYGELVDSNGNDWYANSLVLDLTNWDTSEITSMDETFVGVGKSMRSVTIKGINTFDTSKVTNMNSMFSDAMRTYANIGDLGTKVVTVNGKTYTAWDVSNVTDMGGMFSGVGLGTTSSASKVFNIGDISNWNTSKVTNMSGMFNQAGPSATTFNIGNLRTKTVTVNGKTYTSWDTSKVMNMRSMFRAAGAGATIKFSIGDISNWNTSNVESMDSMFYQMGLNASYSLNLSGWDVSKVQVHDNFNYGVTSKVISPF